VYSKKNYFCCKKISRSESWIILAENVENFPGTTNFAGTMESSSLNREPENPLITAN